MATNTDPHDEGRAIDLTALAKENYTHYISGPMSGLPGFGYQIFENAANALSNAGLKVRSPTEVDGGEAPVSYDGASPYEYYLREAIRIQLNCNSWIGLPGWTGSRGARIEFNLACDLNFKLFTYHTDGLFYWLEEMQ